MDLFEAMRGRRSIRKFKDKPVPLDIVKEILEKAIWAPSNYNMQPWYFAVVTGNKKKKILEAMEDVSTLVAERVSSIFDEKMTKLVKTFTRTFGGAPVIILAYSDRSFGNTPSPPLKFDPGILSVATAIQNLLLLAHEKGLAACWTSAAALVEDNINSILGIEGKDLIAAIPIGYPDQSPPVPPRKGRGIGWYT